MVLESKHSEVGSHNLETMIAECFYPDDMKLRTKSHSVWLKIIP